MILKRGIRMKATEINDMTICKTHCDLIIKKSSEFKNLFSSEMKNIINQNKVKALSDIIAMENSLSELKLFIESI